MPAAKAALAQARALADPARPSGWGFWLVEAEGFVARARGDRKADLHGTRRQVALSETSRRLDGVGLSNLVDAELAAGNLAQAAATSVALVASRAGGRDERSLAYARLNLSAALLALGEHEPSPPAPVRWLGAGAVLRDADVEALAFPAPP